jgi:hypothetical protein
VGKSTLVKELKVAESKWKKRGYNRSLNIKRLDG